MPIPGADFLEAAKFLGDADTEIAGSKTKPKLVKVGELAEDLIEKCLFGGGIQLSLTAKADQKRLMNLIPGHRWAAKREDGSEASPGPERCRIMVLGKCLGDQEVSRGRLFIGPTGKLLVETIRKLGIRGAGSWYITNILKTQPIEEEAWRQSWVRDQLHLLHQELRIVQPEYILCLGADAVKALLGRTWTLGKMRGRVVDYEFDTRKHEDEPAKMHHCSVMGCVHPAAVLRAPERKDEFEQTVSRWGALVDGVRWDREEEGLEHFIVKTEEELLELRARIESECKSRIIAIDAEWHGEHPENPGAYLRTIQLSWAHKKAALIVIRERGGKPAFLRTLRDQKGAKLFKTALDKNSKMSCNPRTTRKGGCERAVEILADILKDKRPVGHFFAADMEWLLAIGLDLRKQFAAPLTWEECRHKGGMDTALMAHAVDETGDFTLTGQTLRYTAAPRYDVALLKWKDDYCKEHGIKAKELEGYGDCPDEILYPYGLLDADVTRRICMKHIKNLDHDRFGNNCWEAFWIGQRAALAVLEINTTGIVLDKSRVDELTRIYLDKKVELERSVRLWARWPELNLNSVLQVRELLFGARYNGKATVDGKHPRLRPTKARSLHAVPILSTGKRPRPWEEIISSGEEDRYMVSTDKTVLSIMNHNSKQLRVIRKGRETTKDYSKVVGCLRDYRFVSQILKSVLRLPLSEKLDDGTEAYTKGDDGFWTYKGGLVGSVCGDGRVRTTIYQTKETGRWSSARPPLQNLGNRREAEYKRILAETYKYPLRTILTAPPGQVLIEADYIGAELFGMAIMSGDETMISHALRNQLPEGDANYYDIHSNVAVLAFGYQCEPTKNGLASIGKKHMRIVAKSVLFGIAYGRGAKAIALAAKEEGVDVTVTQAQQIIDTIFRMYPLLVPFFEECRRRAVPSRDKAYGDCPQWLCGPFGRFRRFHSTDDRKVRGDIERQAQNFPIQGMIADVVSLAIAETYDYRQRRWDEGETAQDIDYRIALQVHDSLMLMSEGKFVPRIVDEVLPTCMVQAVPIHPCSLDGVPNGKGPYRLGIDVNVQRRWGAAMLPGECIELGFDPKYAGWTETEQGFVNEAGFRGKIWRDGSLEELPEQLSV